MNILYSKTMRKAENLQNVKAWINKLCNSSSTCFSVHWREEKIEEELQGRRNNSERNFFRQREREPLKILVYLERRVF